MSPRLKGALSFYAGHERRPVVKAFWKRSDQNGFTLIEASGFEED
jgi:hypothetical protein